MQVTTGSKTVLSWAHIRVRLAALGRGVVAVLRYLFFFEWVVDIARWLIATGGNVAESAFLLATVYVTINTVAHKLVLWVLPGNAILTMNQISVIAFSVLPELIIFAAIKVTLDHFKMAVSSRRVDAWIWAILYSVPTSIFLALTVITISSFVSVEASSASAPLATGVMLVVRCLAGWSYGMLQMLWVRLGHEGYSNLFARLRAEIADLAAKVKARDASIAGLEGEKSGLQGEITVFVATVAARDASIAGLGAEIEELKKQSAHALASLRAHLQGEIDTLQSQGSTSERLLKLRESKIADLQEELAEQKEQNAMLDSELVEARIALARRAGPASDAEEAEEAVSETVVNSERYQLVRRHMQQQLTASGQKINMKKIAADTGVSYNTVRRYAQSILDGLVDRKSA